MDPYTAVIGAVMAGIGGGLSASKEKSMLSNFKLSKPVYETIGQAQQQFAGQAGNLPAVAGLLGKASGMDNLAIRNRILADNPEAGTNTTATSALALSRSMGGLSEDTQDAIKRANAYAALQGGYAGSTMQDTTLALNTAKARQGAMAQAPKLNSAAFGMAEELNPVNPDVAATLIAPGAILKRSDQEQKYNADIRNQERLGDLAANFSNAKNQGSGISTGISGLMSGASSLWGNPGITNLGYSGQTPGTDQFSDSWYQTYGAESGWP